MQIRLSKAGKTIQVLRAKYIPEKKRSTQLVAVTFPSYHDALPKVALEKLNPAEQEEVQAWLNRRKATRKEIRLKDSVGDLPRSMDMAFEGIKIYGITKEQALVIYGSIDKLTKAIRERGFTRAKKKLVEPAEPSPKKKTVSKKKVKKAAKKKIKIKTSPGQGVGKDHKGSNKKPWKGKKTILKKTAKEATKKTAKKTAGKK